MTDDGIDPQLLQQRDIQARGLARMKRLALGLLLAAGVLYAVAVLLTPRHAAWGYVAAFAEAAMVGAMADWFAIVALFRHPLGVPIPHTAIIPRNKARIGANLARFIVGNFLGTAQVLAKLKAFDPAARLAAWLADPAHAEQLGRHLVSAARYGLGALDDDRVRAFLRGSVLTRLQRLDVASLAGQLLGMLTAQGRHQALLDELLQQLSRVLDNEEVKSRLADVIAAEVKVLRYVGLDTVAGKLAAAKLVAGVGRLIADMADDPDHELRQRFDAYMADFIARLKDDPALREKVEAIRHDLLSHPALLAYLHDVWSELLAWLHADLDSPDSHIGARIARSGQRLGAKLQSDPAMRQWINDQVLAAAPGWIARYREDIRNHIVARVETWNTGELTRELERNIGRDLQFVRINGTFVGGLIGLLIHAATQWAVG